MKTKLFVFLLFLFMGCNQYFDGETMIVNKPMPKGFGDCLTYEDVTRTEYCMPKKWMGINIYLTVKNDTIIKITDSYTRFRE